MNSAVENIVRDLFQTTSLQDVSAEQLQQAIIDHPYNGVAHFLLAKKLYTSKETGYEDALQKAALHFPNHLWFHYILNEDENDEEKNIAPEIEIDAITEESEVENLNTSITDEPKINDEKEIIIEEAPVTASTIIQQDEEKFSEENIEVADPVSEKLTSILKEQASAFEKPIEATAEIPIENTPYHRVDYFDSQGIKLEEGKPDDKLGAQLKRFTDWLKQMKRANPNPAELAKDEAGESKVQTLAEHSNESEEIATETMAEVLIKQGKPEQAIQIYEKLSFINPSKSAYFAAKIDELKG
ncbi:MAG: hypothetical protein ABJA35_17620 [Parafilimonas sp.]